MQHQAAPATSVQRTPAALRCLHGRGLSDPRAARREGRLEPADSPHDALPGRPAANRRRRPTRRPSAAGPAVRPHPGLAARDHRTVAGPAARPGRRRGTQTAPLTQRKHHRITTASAISDPRILCPIGPRVKVVHKFDDTRSSVADFAPPILLPRLTHSPHGDTRRRYQEMPHN